MESYFETLKNYEFQNTKYFYGSCGMVDGKQLFIWVVHDTKGDSFIVNSRIMRNLPPTSYTFEIMSINNQQLIFFKSSEVVVVGTNKNSNYTAIKFTVPNNDKFLGTYRDCMVQNDLVVRCKSTHWIGESDNVPITKRVFTSPLYLRDLDMDGKSELFWFAVSNGYLLIYECYEISGLNLKQLQNSKLIENLKIDSNYLRYIEISKMIATPKF